MNKLETGAAGIEQPRCTPKQAHARHDYAAYAPRSHAISRLGRAELSEAGSRRKKVAQNRAASRARTEAATSAVATAEQSRLAIEEGSRLAGGKVKVIGQPHLSNLSRECLLYMRIGSLVTCCEAPFPLKEVSLTGQWGDIHVGRGIGQDHRSVAKLNLQMS